jgi:hypothetical protein
MDIGVITGDGLDENGLRQPAVFLDEFVGRNEFAARIARHIRDQALNLGYPVFPQPVPDSIHWHKSPGYHV